MAVMGVNAALNNNEPFNNVYKSKHVFGVAQCMLCSGSNDCCS